tara:strand:+ start:592 stop:933 length:342 start_codon:yes stop_codon:yes gene_type:complete
MRPMLNHWSFIFPLIVFLGHQTTQKALHLSLPFLDNYLDPFCFTAIAFPLIVLERSWLFSQNKHSKIDLLIIFIFLAIVSEVLLPALSHQFVQDPWDILSMLFGFIWHIQFKP